MKSERVKWKHRAIELAKKIKRSQGYCDWCGKTKYESQMHGSHVYSVSNESTAADLDNLMCHCAYCHIFRWHNKPAEAWDWFEKKWPGRRRRLQKKAGVVVHYSALDWKRIYEELKTTLR